MLRILVVCVLAVSLVGCGGGSKNPDGGVDADGGPDGDEDPGCEPLLSCEDRGAICGWHQDDHCDIIDCGTCRMGGVSLEGRLPSLELDDGDGVHVVYYDWPDDLWYARIVDLTLQDAEVIAPAQIDRDERPPAFVLDAAGTPHVVWRSGNEVFYAVREAAGWSVENLGEGNRPDLAVGGDGTVHVVYGRSDMTSSALRHAFKIGDVWTDTELNPEMSSRPSLYTAGDGTVYLLVAVPRPVIPTFDLGVWTGAEWTFTELISSVYFNGNPLIPALVVDTEGRASFVVQLSNRLEYISEVDGAWTRDELKDDDTEPTHSVALDSSGGVHLVYYSFEGAYYRHVYGLNRFTVGGCSGGGSDIALGANGQVHIVTECGYLTTIGAYTPEYSTTCDSAIERICRYACDCMPGSDCSFFADSGGTNLETTFGPEGICAGWVREDLCNSNTVDPTLIVACDEALAADDGSCVDDRYRLPEACGVVIANQ